VWLVVVWVALWGELSVANVVAGTVVAVVASVVFPLPPLQMHVRVRPLRLAWLVLHFLGDVVVASIQVSSTTLQLHRQPQNAVIEVDLRTESDFVLTVVAEMVSLVPGSLVVEARRSTYTLFLHVLDARDMAGVEKMRSQVFALERRVLLAFGHPVEDPQQPSEGSP
jgi:multicomponent Na+:H+ antiporter subunit E